MISSRPEIQLSGANYIAASRSQDVRCLSGFFRLGSLPILLLLTLTVLFSNVPAEGAPVNLSVPLSAGPIQLKGATYDTGLTAPMERPDLAIPGDSGRFLASLVRFSTIETRVDNTSVETAAAVTGTTSGKPTQSYLDSGATDIAVLSSNNEHTTHHLQISGTIADGAASQVSFRAENGSTRDDFLGHTREFLQTRK